MAVPEQESTTTETIVGCTQARALDLVLLERAAARLSPEYRFRLASDWPSLASFSTRSMASAGQGLLDTLGLTVDDLMDMIAKAPRLSMAVRGWTAQRHLLESLAADRSVELVEPIERDGQPDLRVVLRAGPSVAVDVRVECKNARSATRAGGTIKVDFMRTRAPKGFPCGRYYAPDEFEVLAVCLHPITAKWEFRFKLTRDMAPHPDCEGRLHHNVALDDSWAVSLAAALAGT